jgi:hypothetical protein
MDPWWSCGAQLLMAPERLRFRSLFLYFDLEKGISVAGLIQSVSQAPWPGLSAWVDAGQWVVVGGIAPLPCPKPSFPQPIST